MERALLATSESELLDEFKQWLKYTAWTLADSHDHQKELAQEGWIEIWKTWKKYPGRGKSYYRVAARHRMLKTLKALALTEVPTDDTAEIDSAVSFELESAYHDGEINAAIEKLKPRQREYVRLRFWNQYNPTELARHFGTAPDKIWNRTKNVLSKELKHLGDE